MGILKELRCLYRSSKKMVLPLQGTSGNSLIQVLVAAGILAIVMMSTLSVFTNQTHANNFLEFQAKKEQLRLALLGQVLTSPEHCKCLFQGAAPFPTTGTPELSGYVPPTALGKFTDATCAGGVPHPLVSSDGTDGLKLISTRLTNIALAGGSYAGELLVQVDSTKKVLGPSSLQLKIPVAVITSSGTPGVVSFEGCANLGASSASSTGAMTFTTVCRHGMPCYSQADILCNNYVGSADYCLKDLFTTTADGGTKNVNVKGYSCKPGLCANGTKHDFTGPAM